MFLSELSITRSLAFACNHAEKGVRIGGHIGMILVILNQLRTNFFGHKGPCITRKRCNRISDL